MSPLAALGSVIDSVTKRAPPQMTSSPDDYVQVENVGFHKSTRTILRVVVLLSHRQRLVNLTWTKILAIRL